MPEFRGAKILGFSGLDRARRFKRESWPQLTPAEENIHQGADAAAALVVNGTVISAAAQERFDGVKHSSKFPEDAIRFCLDTAAVEVGDIDVIAHSFDYAPHESFFSGQSEYHRALYAEVLSPEVNQAIAEEALGPDFRGEFLPVGHHVAHAASAYYPSGFTDALVVVSDGLGEKHSATVLAASPRGFDVLREVPAHSSMGALYGIFTLYLGFEFGDGEYKVMGLAPHGDRTKYAELILREWVHLEPEGAYSIPLLLANVTELDRETYRGALEVLERTLGPRRSPDSPLEQRHMDVAAGLQEVLQAVQLHVVSHFRRLTGLKQLCLAGGVALNCVANGMILRSGLFEDMFIQPASGDDGAALGAALHASAGDAIPAARHEAEPLLGPEYSDGECAKAAQSVAVTCTTVPDETRYLRAAAEALARGEVLGWFHGRMEFGPRALGNRSILADPRREEMRDHINALVKKRESFRPFAPAVPEELAHHYFEIDPEDAHIFRNMLLVAHVKPEYADKLPAAVHVDGSARVQTVSSVGNRLFWKLLMEFGETTGLPVLLNTSFNVRGQPIVRTPQQAVDTLLDARLDALFMKNMVIRQNSSIEDSCQNTPHTFR